MFAVLDTNHFREVAGGGVVGANIARRAADASIEVFLSIITIQEATSGWLALINSITAGRDQISGYSSFQRTVTAFQNFDILPFDREAADAFHHLKVTLPRIGTMDLKIAAVCLAHDATLLTRNMVDFEKIPGLRVENWLD